MINIAGFDAETRAVSPMVSLAEITRTYRLSDLSDLTQWTVKKVSGSSA